MTRPNVCHILILHLVSILTISPQSTCHSAPVCKILSKSDQPQQNKMTSCRFLRWRISAILDFRGPIMGSLKSPCTTSYRSSVDTIALNCLVFEKIAFLQLGDRQTNRWTRPLHEAALAVASSGLTMRSRCPYQSFVQTWERPWFVWKFDFQLFSTVAFLFLKTVIKTLYSSQNITFVCLQKMVMFFKMSLPDR